MIFLLLLAGAVFTTAAFVALLSIISGLAAMAFPVFGRLSVVDALVFFPAVVVGFFAGDFALLAEAAATGFFAAGFLAAVLLAIFAAPCLVVDSLVVLAEVFFLLVEVVTMIIPFENL
ncbi:MAG: hypothetical protein ACLQHK_10490 [Gallionellaceae bacterium]